MDHREEAISRLSRLTEPEVVILGGGVNGIAVLRDLALNGVSAVLIERHDYCRGASGASSRMAHGGLRYLENREFGLVREALCERDLLMQYAPHSVAPLEFLLPVEHRLRGSLGAMLSFLGLCQRKAQPSALGIKAALTLYDRFRTSSHLPRHRTCLSRTELPTGTHARFKASLSYFDGKFINPEGLVFEMLEEAMATSPQVTALNHVDMRPGVSGAMSVSDSGVDAQISPQIIINATGAWLDETNALLGVPTDYATAVKGAQIILDHPDLLTRLAGRAFYFPDLKGRFVICAPFEKSVLVGTTEIVVDRASDNSIDETEIAYLLGAINSLFEDIAVSEDHIRVATTGARPLRKITGHVTDAPREHAVLVDKTPSGQCLISMVGGKWTTFRPFAQEAVDHVLDRLARGRIVSTASRPYRGTPAPGSKLPDDDCHRRLAGRYGAIWPEVARFCEAREDAPLVQAPDYTHREILWLIRARGALALDDLILRRTRLALERSLTDALLLELAALLADARGKDMDWAAAEVRRVAAMPTIRFRKGKQCVAAANGPSMLST